MPNMNDSIYPMIPKASVFVNSEVLAANTNITRALPTGYAHVNLSATADFYVKFGTSGAVAAAVPAGSVTNGTASALNPSSRQIPSDATHIALISEVAAKVTLEFWN